MAIYWTTQLLFILVSSCCVATGKTYIITSADQPCPRESMEEQCITLEQFANDEYNITKSRHTSSPLTIDLLPGVHFLNTSHMVVSHTNRFTMNGSKSTIFCTRSNSFEFPLVPVVKISGITFTNCGGSDFRGVNNIAIDNCNFLNHQKSWKLFRASNATIVKTSFLNGHTGPFLRVTSSSLLIKDSTLINNTGCDGAAIYCKSSTLKIEWSIFLQNSAKTCVFIGRGGAVFSANTYLNITDSNFTDNMALTSGGALYIL